MRKVLSPTFKQHGPCVETTSRQDNTHYVPQATHWCAESTSSHVLYCPRFVKITHEMRYKCCLNTCFSKQHTMGTLMWIISTWLFLQCGCSVKAIKANNDPHSYLCRTHLTSVNCVREMRTGDYHLQQNKTTTKQNKKTTTTTIIVCTLSWFLFWLHIYLAPSYLCTQLYSSRIQQTFYRKNNNNNNNNNINNKTQETDRWH